MKDYKTSLLASIKTVLKFAIPLSIISFATFTKWLLVYPVDGPDTIMLGFPLPFIAEGLHTSMSFQFFILEFIIDLLCYLLLWSLLLLSISRSISKIRFKTAISFVLNTLAGLVIVVSIYLGSFPEHVYLLKRNWSMEVVDSGFQITFQEVEYPGPELKPKTK